MHPQSRTSLSLANALVLVAGATICLGLTTFSTLWLKSIYFLSAAATRGLGAGATEGDVRFGVFGYCIEDVCSSPQINYFFFEQLLVTATGAQAILFPLALAFSILAVFSLLLNLLLPRVSESKHARRATVALEALASGTTLLVGLIAVGTWAVARGRFGVKEERRGDEKKARFGAAFALAIAAMVLHLLAPALVTVDAIRKRRAFWQPENEDEANLRALGTSEIEEKA